MNESINMSFLSRMKDFFGYGQNGNIKTFAKELRELTREDKVELCRLFNESGMPTDAPK